MRAVLFIGALCSLMISTASICAAQSDSPATAPGQQNDGAYPPDFDCESLAAAKAKLECNAYQHNLLKNPPTPGTPAIPLPGMPNTMNNNNGLPSVNAIPEINGPEITGPNNGEGVGTKGSGAGISR
ncbi:MAG TPA: hypothetical protein VGM59_18470 [Dongiaceae bacterium]|jgi:hypothetical protein